MIEEGDAGDGADTRDDGQAVEHAAETEVLFGVGGKMAGADGAVDQDDQYGEADDKDEVGFF